MTLLGETGLQRLAAINHANASALAESLSSVPGVSVLNDSFFNEFTVRLPRPATPVVEELAARGVLAGVPPALDDIAARALGLTERGALRTPREVAQALERAAGRLVPVELDRDGEEDVAAAPGSATRPGPLAVAAVTVIAVLAAAALAVGVLAWSASTRETAVAGGSTSPTAGATGSSPAPLGGPIPIVSVRDFDPAGNGQENPSLAPLAIDGKTSTAWMTVFYDRADLGGLKPGVGLLLDLGAPTPIGAVRVELVGRGTDLELRASSSLPVTADDAITVAQATNAGDLVTLRPDPQVEARYLVLWLTKLPRDGTRYRGGVSEVQVLRN
jgi:hypothetical protein